MYFFFLIQHKQRNLLCFLVLFIFSFLSFNSQIAKFRDVLSMIFAVPRMCAYTKCSYCIQPVTIYQIVFLKFAILLVTNYHLDCVKLVFCSIFLSCVCFRNFTDGSFMDAKVRFCSCLTANYF